MVTLITEEKQGSIYENVHSGQQLTVNLPKRSLWTKIAKNEIRVRTSAVRNHRALFFISIYGILSIWMRRLRAGIP